MSNAPPRTSSPRRRILGVVRSAAAHRVPLAAGERRGQDARRRRPRAGRRGPGPVVALVDDGTGASGGRPDADE
ncbi:hypothetical protein [Actinomycetospora sp. CA-084318]|uniref:hypothetical protein n=1 Tax=Actinomycetospora sp. CA-084318 TaxID=3239892 RepID=UPI003D95DD9F